MERQEQRIARDVRRTHERVRGAIETEKWRSDIEVEHARIQGDANGRAIEGDRKSQWPREQHGGDRRGARLVGAASPVMRNRPGRQPYFTIPDMGVLLCHARLSITQRFYLGPCKHESRLPRLQEMVIVPGFRVPGDGDFFHVSSARYALTWG